MKTKWAILSDIHGNLEAFRAVIQNLSGERVERIAFLGDVVGYGADPNECLSLLKSLTGLIVAGNHDYGAVGLTDVSYFNPMAKEAILWTGEKLTEESRAFLRGLPLWHEVEGITFVHATPNESGEWNYIFNPREARESFRAMSGEVVFIGHSHYPLIFAEKEGRIISVLEEEEIILQEGMRYIINVGSVGQPRDRNLRAAYGLYDEGSKKYLLKRVPYDVPTAQKKILKAGLPPFLAQRLALGV
ncbi:MAG: hypothetical protein A2Z51_00945 [Deltaproteobacteria bacterium RBG_19FT_COMBO_52_11]|nr:MAG: hypothetical protein A2Z51_00945 [Deltaproteobacteria bacterium RBG_19FT_COMBO_52_11]